MLHKQLPFPLHIITFNKTLEQSKHCLHICASFLFNYSLL
ncbi:hypothetical protein EVA_07488 [gut metagenome]|uniref:Uncharacterized protein n=1 Tax=gut metagenome TaxID=749906 RepID=J9GC26_9ZZZZ